MTRPEAAKLKLRIALLACLFALLLASTTLAQDATASVDESPASEPTVEPLAEGPVTTVNGESVPAALFQQRVRLTRFLYAYTLSETLNGLLDSGIAAQNAVNAVQAFFADEFRLLQVHDLIGDRVLDTLERDVLLRQIAAERGLTVDDEAIDTLILDYINRPRTLVASAQGTADEPSPSDEALEAFYAEAFTRVGVSSEVVRDFFEAQALRDVVLEDEFGPMPQEWPFVTVRHILVASYDQATDVLAQLENGADFAELAENVSIDQSTAAEGGALGTTISEVFVEPFAEAVREAPVGEFAGPVETQFGYHIFQVTERETRLVDAEAIEALARARSREFQNWLSAQVIAADIKREPDWFDLIPVQPVGEELLRQMISR
ncbi:MAG: peptidylprolyl isomerase [Chloroflexota bacterium]|mgnify:CR=1 FL=1|nr:MAG: hypothetical protein DIU68_05730 [Chloroflexota bacterium]